MGLKSTKKAIKKEKINICEIFNPYIIPVNATFKGKKLGVRSISNNYKLEMFRWSLEAEKEWNEHFEDISMNDFIVSGSGWKDLKSPTDTSKQQLLILLQDKLNRISLKHFVVDIETGETVLTDEDFDTLNGMEDLIKIIDNRSIKETKIIELGN